LRRALNLDPRSEAGRRLDAVVVVTRDTSGRAERLEVRGEHTHVVRGEDLRAILNRTLGDRGIESTRFSVARAGSTYEFQGTGFGHGVGLCQVGAAARARQGQAAPAILATYFPGTTLARIN
jgi:stage II sporulation protein D